MMQKQTQRQIPNLSKIEHIVTHNGVFHADECFAIAFLNIAAGRHPANEDLFDVIRVNNTDVDQYKDREDCIIIDIGDGEFDHHSNNNKEYRQYSRKGSDGEKEYKRYYYASFGKVVRAFHTLIDAIADDRSYKFFDRNFVCKIDGYDNGDRTYYSDFSNLINEMNPVWNADVIMVKEDVSYNFMDAICFCMFIISKKLEVIKASKDADVYLAEAKKNEKNHILILETYIPYIGKLNPDTEYVIFPSSREKGWNLSVCKNEIGEFIKPLPKEWYGFNREPNPPVEGLLFCHQSGFLAVFDTLENAVKAVTTS